MRNIGVVLLLLVFLLGIFVATGSNCAIAGPMRLTGGPAKGSATATFSIDGQAYHEARLPVTLTETIVIREGTAGRLEFRTSVYRLSVPTGDVRYNTRIVQGGVARDFEVFVQYKQFEFEARQANFELGEGTRSTGLTYPSQVTLTSLVSPTAYWLIRDIATGESIAGSGGGNLITRPPNDAFTQTVTDFKLPHTATLLPGGTSFRFGGGIPWREEIGGLSFSYIAFGLRDLGSFERMQISLPEPNTAHLSGLCIAIFVVAALTRRQISGYRAN